MKAKIKSTGEIVEVSPNGVTSVQRTCTKYATKDGRELIDLALEFLPNIDWEQRRYEIAKEAMSGILSSEHSTGYASLAAEYSKNEKHTYPKAISRYAVACADALIKELKGSEE